MALIEYSWNVYPSTNMSSGLLLACHVIILSGVLYSKNQKMKHQSLQESLVANPMTEKYETKKLE